MKTKQEKLILLRRLLEEDKLGDSQWIERGLNPSSKEVIEFLNQDIEQCIVEAIESIEQGESEEEIRKRLRIYLKSVDKTKYDTEEKEILADLFVKVYRILELDESFFLTKWFYGGLLGMLIYAYSKRPTVIKRILRKGKISNKREYNIVTDRMVIAYQIGEISLEEMELLSRYIGDFESRKSRNE